MFRLLLFDRKNNCHVCEFRQPLRPTVPFVEVIILVLTDRQDKIQSTTASAY